MYFDRALGLEVVAKRIWCALVCHDSKPRASRERKRDGGQKRKSGKYSGPEFHYEKEGK